MNIYTTNILGRLTRFLGAMLIVALMVPIAAICQSQYAVVLESSPVGAGNLHGAGTFNLGDVVTVSTSSKSGFKFVNWAEKVTGNPVSTNASMTFPITGDTTLVANFVVGQPPVNLGSAERFAILSNSAITAIPTSAITGDVGISPGVRSSILGFVLTPDGSNTFSTSPEVTGKVFAADDAVSTPAMLILAKNDAEAAFADATAAVRGTSTSISGNINGLTLVPGLYESGSSIEISPGGKLYLDAMGDANAVFVIRSATSITTEATSQVVLTNNAQTKNIFWSAGSSVTLGTNSIMKGTIIASTSISLLTQARLDGRALIQGATAGQVSLDQNIIMSTLVTSVENDLAPQEFVLFQNYPNPFNPSTKIQYSLERTAHVSLKVYNLLGCEVATLVNSRQAAGSYTVPFNTSKGTLGLSSGVYFYRLEAGSFVSTKKFVLMK